MSRPRLGRTDSVVIALRLPRELAEQLSRELVLAGETRSEVGRRMFEHWIRKRRAVARAKGGRA